MCDLLKQDDRKMQIAAMACVAKVCVCVCARLMSSVCLCVRMWSSQVSRDVRCVRTARGVVVAFLSVSDKLYGARWKQRTPMAATRRVVYL